MNPHHIRMKLLADQFAIHRFDSGDTIPYNLLDDHSEYHISKTEDEISSVCSTSITLPSRKISKSYSCLKVLGPLDFTLVGIISKITSILKSRDIPVFVISTFDTDYILIKTDNTDVCINALNKDEYISITNVPN